MYHYFKIHKYDDGVINVVFDTPDESVNTLSEASALELRRVVRDISKENPVGIIFSSGKKDFVVGANIDEISRFKSALEGSEGSASLQGVFNEIENLKFPTAAEIKGQCLGGGLELALSCTYILASNDSTTKLGFPEVQLGLLPGAGGTQRTPRRIGIQASLDMILTGKNFDAKKAQKIGLIDLVVDPKCLTQECLNIITGKTRLPKKKNKLNLSSVTNKFLEGNPIGRQIVKNIALKKTIKQAGTFYPAPYKIIEAICDGFSLPLQRGLDLEAKFFGELSQTSAASNLIHLFRAITHNKKSNKSFHKNDDTKESRARLIGIVGAGFMGSGIATVSVDRGFRVRLSDPNSASIGKALKFAQDFFLKKVQRRSLKKFEAESKLAHISPGLDTTGFNHCDIVVEAVFEDLNLKHTIIRGIEDLGGTPIIASNTSALPIRDIASQSKSPERIIGMHFFSPVEKMPLIEVIKTPLTSLQTVQKVVGFGEALGKKVIVVNDGPGFFTTRALAFYLYEALKIVLDGAPIEDVDSALLNYGFPVGPITLIDEVGIDVGLHVIETMANAFPDRIQSISKLEGIIKSGHFGRKNGKGFYRYEGGKKQATDANIYSLLGLSKPSPGKISQKEIQDRCVLVFINESVRCLEENILTSPYDGDIGAVFGLGFPPFLGGPFRVIESKSPTAVKKELEILALSHGPSFQPARIFDQFCDQNYVFKPTPVA